MAGKQLKIIFMGTPDFSVPVLTSLLDAGHEVVCVYSQPPRKSGRGQKLRPGPVHAAAQAHGIEVRTPVSLKDVAEQQAFAALDADVAVVVAYGLILPEAVLAAPRLGCVNIHASLLPRWRGAAPIQRALIAGDEKTGVTIMQMDQGLDTGPMLMSEALHIPFDMNAEELHDALSQMGGRMVVAALLGLANGTIEGDPQPQDGVTYAKKIDKLETRLDWSQTAEDLAHKVRGLYPLAWFEVNGLRVRVHAAKVENGSGTHGRTLDDGLLVACGQGALRLTHVQPAGKGVMDAAAFLNGRAVPCDTDLN